MADRDARQHDEGGEELDDTVFSLGMCPMNRYCYGDPTKIKILPPEVDPDIVLPPAPERVDWETPYPSLYHYALSEYLSMLCNRDDPGAWDAFKGDFVVQVRYLSQDNKPTSKDRFFVGLGAEHKGGVGGIEKTELEGDEGAIMKGMIPVGWQEVAECPECKEHLKITIWAEHKIDWEEIRKRAEYMIEETGEHPDDKMSPMRLTSPEEESE